MTDVELLHAPVWFVEYSFKGKPMYITIDGNSGLVMEGERPSVRRRCARSARRMR